jgi:hypothetical protein
VSLRRELGRYVRTFFTNLDQPGMPATEKWSKFARNRFKATVLLRGCCGHPGEPGC